MKVKLISYELDDFGAPVLVVEVKRWLLRPAERRFAAVCRITTNYYAWAELPDMTRVRDRLSFRLDALWREVRERELTRTPEESGYE